MEQQFKSNKDSYCLTEMCPLIDTTIKSGQNVLIEISLIVSFESYAFKQPKSYKNFNYFLQKYLIKL
jgi:hypothetical protein